MKYQPQAYVDNVIQSGSKTFTQKWYDKLWCCVEYYKILNLAF